MVELVHVHTRGLLACAALLLPGVGACGSEPLPGPQPADLGVALTANCEALHDTAQIPKCYAFVRNQREYVLPAVEQVTGTRFRDCVSEIRLAFVDVEAVEWGGRSFIADGVGFLEYNTRFSDMLFAPDSVDPFDDHEPAHLGYSCVRVSSTYNIAHVAWLAMQGEVDASIYELSDHRLGASAADSARGKAEYWVEEVAAGRGGFVDAGPDYGCARVISYLLSREYVRPNYAIIHDWLRLLRSDRVLAQLDYLSPEAEARLEALTFALLQPEPALRAELAPYCPSIAD